MEDIRDKKKQKQNKTNKQNTKQTNKKQNNQTNKKMVVQAYQSSEEKDGEEPGSLSHLSPFINC